MKSGVEAARVAALDGLRGLAALLVFFSHTLQWPKGGYLGVDLFFVLSGFLITSLLLRELADTGRLHFVRFFARRVRRLVPAFLVMALLYAGLRYCLAPEQPALTAARLLRLLLLANVSVSPPLLSHAWSLAVEWQFYLVWPFVLALGAALLPNRLHLAGLCLAGSVLAWVARERWGVNLHVDGLLLGAAMAGFAQSGRLNAIRRLPRLEDAALLAALVGIVLLAAGSNYGAGAAPAWVGSVCVPLLTFLILAVVLRGESRAARIVLGHPVLTYFGRISYGLYLYHFPIAAVMFLHDYSPVAMLLGGVAFCVPLSDMSWRWVERPLLHRRRPRAALIDPAPHLNPLPN